jgi:hypothetical protein
MSSLPESNWENVLLYKLRLNAKSELEKCKNKTGAEPAPAAAKMVSSDGASERINFEKVEHPCEYSPVTHYHKRFSSWLCLM